MLCLPLEELHGWLFSINSDKVKLEFRDTVILYQKECFKVLYDYWHLGKAENPRFKSKIIYHSQARRELDAFVKSYMMVGYNKSAAMIMAMDNLLNQYGYDFPASFNSTREVEVALIIKKYGPAFYPDSDDKAPQYHSEDKWFYEWVCIMISDAELWEKQTNLSVANMYTHYARFCVWHGNKYKSKNAWNRQMRRIFEEHIRSYQKSGENGRHYKFSDLKTCRRQVEKHIGGFLEDFTKKQRRLTMN